jgi:hypothetical protein
LVNETVKHKLTFSIKAYGLQLLPDASVAFTVMKASRLQLCDCRLNASRQAQQEKTVEAEMVPFANAEGLKAAQQVQVDTSKDALEEVQHGGAWKIGQRLRSLGNVASNKVSPMCHRDTWSKTS